MLRFGDRCQLRQRAKVGQEKTGIGERVNSLSAKSEAVQDPDAGITFKSDVVDGPVAARALITVFHMRFQDGDLPRAQNGPLAVKEEFTAAGYAVKDLPQREAVRAPDRLLKVVYSDAAEQERDSFPLAFCHTYRIAHICYPQH